LTIRKSEQWISDTGKCNYKELVGRIGVEQRFLFHVLTGILIVCSGALGSSVLGSGN
jgi:hypothetical protein